MSVATVEVPVKQLTVRDLETEVSRLRSDMQAFCTRVETDVASLKSDVAAVKSDVLATVREQARQDGYRAAQLDAAREAAARASCAGVARELGAGALEVTRELVKRPQTVAVMSFAAVVMAALVIGGASVATEVVRAVADRLVP